MEERNLLKVARERGFILGLENIWFDMAELTCISDREKAAEIWRNAGVWFASRYAMESNGDAVRSLEKELKAFIWNMPEFKLSQGTNELSVRIINPRFSESYSVLFAAFMEGALEALGYAVKSQEVSSGSVRLAAVKGKRKAVPITESLV